MSAIEFRPEDDVPDHIELHAAETPGGTGEIWITGAPGIIDKDHIRDIADNFVEERQPLINAILRHGKDAVAMATSRGIVLYVGVGVATLATAVGAVLIWKQLHKKDSPE